MRRSSRLAASADEPEAASEVSLKRSHTPPPNEPPEIPRAPSRPSSVSPKKRKLQDEPLLPLLPPEEVELRTTIKRASLPFSLDKAREHLCAADKRFIPLFSRYPIKAYAPTDEPLNLYRTIINSILGQQISWLAAKAIMSKFLRIFDPSLPEDTNTTDFFPSPLAVLQVEDKHLREAGLSMSKIAYVRDVSRRFADGRFDVRKIATLSADECIDVLTQAKGVGRWTAEMMLMFALRHPDVLPTGDLGVQRGMVNFFLACNCGEKLKEEAEQPSCICDGESYVPTGTSLTPTTLSARAKGNKTSKKMYLDEKEMYSLTEHWVPYRSVGTMFMWRIKSL